MKRIISFLLIISMLLPMTLPVYAEVSEGLSELAGEEVSTGETLDETTEVLEEDDEPAGEGLPETEGTLEPLFFVEISDFEMPEYGNNVQYDLDAGDNATASVEWRINGNASNLETGESYPRGRHYTARIIVTPNDGYVFEPGDDGSVPVTLAGHQDLIDDVTYNSASGDVWITTNELFSGYVDALDFSYLPSPEEGKEPSFAKEIACGGHSAISGVSWTDLTSGTVLSEGDVFLAGHEYAVTFSVSVTDEMWALTDDNGELHSVICPGNSHLYGNTTIGQNVSSAEITFAFNAVEGTSITPITDDQIVDFSSFPLPIIGQKAPFDLAPYIEHTQTVNAEWYDKTTYRGLSEEDVFERGHAYSATFELCPDDNFSLPSFEEMREQFPDGTYLGSFWWNDNTFEISVECEPLVDDTMQLVDIHDIPIPVAGEVPVYDIEYDHAQVINVVWWDDTIGGAIQAGDTFIPGHRYQVIVRMQPEEGWYIIDRSDVIDSDAVAQSNISSGEPCFLRVDFKRLPVEGAEVIESIDIWDVEAPVEGNEPDHNITLSNTVELVSAEWQYASSRTPVEGVFAAAKSYQLVLKVKPADGYVFPDVSKNGSYNDLSISIELDEGYTYANPQKGEDDQIIITTGRLEIPGPGYKELYIGDYIHLDIEAPYAGLTEQNRVTLDETLFREVEYKWLEVQPQVWTDGSGEQHTTYINGTLLENGEEFEPDKFYMLMYTAEPVDNDLYDWNYWDLGYSGLYKEEMISSDEDPVYVNVNDNDPTFTAVVVYHVRDDYNAKIELAQGYGRQLSTVLDGVTWNSSVSSVATVDENGYVTGLVPGHTSIFANGTDGNVEKFLVKVCSPAEELTIVARSGDASGDAVSGQILKVEEVNIQLDAETLPEGASSLVQWTSSNEEVAFVDPYTGLVNYINDGKSVITAVVQDGTNIQASVTLQFGPEDLDFSHFPAPIIGDQIPFGIESLIGNATVRDTQWYDNKTFNELSEGSAYEFKHDYSLYMVVIPDEGWAMPSEEALSEMLQSPWTLTNYDDWGDGEYYICLRTGTLIYEDTSVVEFNNIPIPVAYGEVPFSLEFDHAAVRKVTWRDVTLNKELSEGSAFVEGHVYRLEAECILDDGWVVLSGSFDPESDQIETSVARDYDDYAVLTVSYKRLPIDGYTFLENVSLSGIAEPVVDEMPSSDLEVSTGYEIISAGWYYASTGKPVEGTFTDSKSYKLQVVLRPSEGYRLPDAMDNGSIYMFWTDATTVSGDWHDSTYKINSDGNLVVTVTGFAIDGPDYKQIYAGDYVFVQVKAPVAGETNLSRVTMGHKDVFKQTKCEWHTGVKNSWIDSEGIVHEYYYPGATMKAGEYFEPGNHYYLWFDAKAIDPDLYNWNYWDLYLDTFFQPEMFDSDLAPVSVNISAQDPYYSLRAEYEVPDDYKEKIDVATGYQVILNSTLTAPVWASEDEDIVAVDASGTVTGVTEGKVTVTATDGEGNTERFYISVYPATEQLVIVARSGDASGDAVSERTIQVLDEDTVELEECVLPGDASHAVMWTGNNDSVATVDYINGTVTRKSDGVVTITLHALDGTERTTWVKFLFGEEKELDFSTIPAPVIGEAIPFNFEDLISNATVTGYEWYDSKTGDIAEGSVYEFKHDYTLGLYIVPSEGWLMPSEDALRASIPSPWRVESYSYDEWEGLYYISLRSGALLYEDTQIVDFSSIVVPREGETSGSLLNLEHVTTRSALWTDLTSGDSVAQDGVFVAGHQYLLVAELIPDEGWVILEGDNGVSSDDILSFYASDQGDQSSLRVIYKRLPIEGINLLDSVSLSGITVPEEGEMPSTEISVSEGYETVSADWYFAANNTKVEEPFIGSKSYYLKVVLRPEEGYRLVDARADGTIYGFNTDISASDGRWYDSSYKVDKNGNLVVTVTGFAIDGPDYKQIYAGDYVYVQVKAPAAGETNLSRVTMGHKDVFKQTKCEWHTGVKGSWTDGEGTVHEYYYPGAAMKAGEYFEPGNHYYLWFDAKAIDPDLYNWNYWDLYLDTFFQPEMFNSDLAPVSVNISAQDPYYSLRAEYVVEDIYADKVDVANEYRVALESTLANASWVSEDEGVATVDENGVITGVTEGKAIIVGTDPDGKTEKFYVSVYPATTRLAIFAASGDASGDAVSERMVQVVGEDSIQLDACVIPGDASYSLEWSTSDDIVAEVDQTGAVTRKSDGKAIVTVRSLDGTNTETWVTVRFGQDRELDLSGFPAPVIGEEIPVQIDRVLDHVFVQNQQWTDVKLHEEVEDGSLFERGHRYSAAMTLCAEDGWVFPSVEDALTQIPEGWTVSYNRISDTLLELTVECGYLIDDETNIVEIKTVPEIAAGQLIPFEYQYENTTTKSMYWIDMTVGGSINDGATFIAGHRYNVVIRLETDEGWEIFDEGNITVESDQVKEVRVSRNYETNEYSIYIEYERIPVEGKDFITELEFSGIKTPVADEVPDYSFFLVGNNSEIVSAEWKFAATGAPVENTFITGKSYELEIVVRPDEGFAFPDASISGNINELHVMCGETGWTETRKGEGDQVIISVKGFLIDGPGYKDRYIGEDFSINITAPIAGVTKQNRVTIDESIFEVTRLKWFLAEKKVYEDSEGNEIVYFLGSELLEEGQPFEPGQYYRLQYFAKPKDNDVYNWNYWDQGLEEFYQEGMVTCDREPEKILVSDSEPQVEVNVFFYVEDDFAGKAEIGIGASKTLKSSLGTVTWKTNNSKVAKVDKTTGVVTAVAEGKAVITATGNDSSERFYVTVMPATTSVVITDETGESVNGQTLKLEADEVQLSAYTKPSSSSDAVKFTSSDKTIATVGSTSGKVTRKSNGTVTITATAQDGSGKKATVTINFVTFVKEIEITGKTDIAVGKTAALKAATNEDATTQTVTWKSSNKEVATVTSAGVVTGKAPGSATITATAKDGSNVSGTFEIEVHPAVTSVVIMNENGTDITGKTKKYEAEKVYLSASTGPDNAIQTVKWTSSDKTIATVTSKTGVVTWKKNGKVTITATAQDGTKVAASVTLNFVTYVKELEISGTPDIAVGKTTTLTAKVNEDATTQTVTWASDDKAVATVTSTGVVTGKKPGTATITATAKDGSKVSGTFEIEVHPAVTSVVIKNESGTDITGKTKKYEAEKVYLSAVTEPDGAIQTVKWTSSDKTIATVTSKTGVVTWKKNGKVTITATAQDGTGVKATVTLNFVTYVKELEISGKTDIAVGKTASLTTTVNEDATTKTVTWKSSDTNIATVTSEGVVTGKNPGTVTITATAKDGSKVFAEHDVTVHPLVTEVVIMNENGDVITGKTKKYEAEKVYLSASTGPEDAIQTVKWTSSDTSIATVGSKSGTVTWKKNGTVTITATAQDGSGVKAIVKLKFVTYVKELKITGSTNELAVGKTLTLKATANSDATTQTVIWTSSNEDIATVSADGVVTAVALGETMITATAKDGSKVSATYDMKVMPISTKVYITTEDDKSVVISGKTIKCPDSTIDLSAYTSPEGSSDIVRWTSSDTTIATVTSKSGVVTWKKSGTVTITATARDGSKKKATVTLSH